MYIFFQACHQFLIQHLLLLEPFGLRKFLHSFLSNAVVANRSKKQASGLEGCWFNPVDRQNKSGSGK